MAKIGDDLMNRLLTSPKLINYSVLVLLIWGTGLPMVKADPPVISVDSVEAPDVPTGSSQDIQGIERNVNNWDWGMGGSYSQQISESTSPSSSSIYRFSQPSSDNLQWERIGEPEVEKTTVPLGKFQ